MTDTETSPRFFLGALAIAVALLVLAVAYTIGVAARADHAAPAAAHGQVAPLDLSTVAPDIAAHYHFASAHMAEFRHIPCWCGCQQFLGHRNLADCFVRADGRGWEAHAAGCGVCNGEAAVAERMLGEGTSAADVKAAVDQQYGTTAITAPPATR